MPKLKEFYFTIDLRSLGLYRVLLAGLLVVDWVGCQPNPAAFYAGLVIYLLLLVGYRTRLFQLLSLVFFAGVCDHGDAVPVAMIAACALVLMPPDWKLFRARLRPVTIYYDDTCGFCHWCAQLLVIADRLGNLRFIGNHDTAAFRHELTRAELESSIVVFDE